jgi:hypothetical protein
MYVFFTALAWGLVVVASFLGWGWLATGRTVRRGHDDSTAAGMLELPGWGMTFSVLAGGMLNLLGIANRHVIVAYVIAGAIASLLPLRTIFRRRTEFLRPLLADGPAALAVGVILALLCLRLASSVIVPSYNPKPEWRDVQFNPHDDMHSYLVSVERMLQTGSVGLDPFNSRQVANALGGQHFLNAVTIAPLRIDHLHMLEAGLAVVVLSLASAAIGLRIAPSRYGVRAAATLMLVPLLIEWPIRNLSSVVTVSVALLLLASATLAVIAARAAGESPRRSIWLAALALAAACVLKSTLIPVACLSTAAAFVLAAILIRRPRLLIDGVLVGGVAIVLMLPWMIWQYRQSGTLLYPILGRGCYVDAATVPVPSLAPDVKTAAALPALLPAVLLIVTSVALISRKLRAAIGWPLAAVVLASLAAWTLAHLNILQLTDMPGTTRYTASAQAVGLTLVLAACWRITAALAGDSEPTRLRHAGAIALAALIVFTAPQWSEVYFAQLPTNLSASVGGKTQPWDVATQRVRSMQQVVPAGEPLLAYLSQPALLDFGRNRIYVADWPGESSPPPGMPSRSGADALATYLLDQHVRCVAYSYANAASFPRRRYGNYVSPRYGRIVARQAALSFAFQDVLGELMRSRRILFDDGANVVFDLETPADAAPAMIPTTAAGR